MEPLKNFVERGVSQERDALEERDGRAVMVEHDLRWRLLLVESSVARVSADPQDRPQHGAPFSGKTARRLERDQPMEPRDAEPACSRFARVA